MFPSDLIPGAVYSIPTVARAVHLNAVNKGFWDGEDHNDAEKIALMHSELSEALEALRTDPEAPDPKVPQITNLAAELADVVIRIFDYCEGVGIDINEAIIAKHNYNRTRPHKHGKAF